MNARFSAVVPGLDLRPMLDTTIDQVALHADQLTRRRSEMEGWEVAAVPLTDLVTIRHVAGVAVIGVA